MRPLTRPLRTPRLRLEPVTPAIAAAARESGEALERALGAQAPADWRGSSLALVARQLAHARPVRALVIHAPENSIIGDVRFEMARREDAFEIGYSIAPRWRRQGFAAEAAGAVIDWLLCEGGELRLIAGCDRRNIASVRTLRKLGFWLDGMEGGAFWWFIDQDLRSNASRQITRF